LRFALASIFGSLMMNERRAAVYARFSTDLQSDRSVDDQIALCRDFASRNDLTIVKTYSDKARSGASVIGRDGLLELLADAKARKFDVIVVEALDRLSRDQEDLAGLHKRMTFLGIDILAVHDGKADAVQVGIRGLVSSLFLSDLKHKIRRGMTGRVRDGLSAGGKAYGYRPVPGKPGELEIDEAEAEIVKRIYQEFAAGRSTRDIAQALNRENVPPPRGAVWNPSTLNGNAQRGNGILRNPLYTGTMVWNRVKMVRDPDTGKRVSRINPESEWQTAEVPELRIVSEDTTGAVARRLAGAAKAHGTFRPRAKRVLSGLLKCGACGGGMTLDGKTDGKPRIRCVRAREAGTCNHTRKYQLPMIEEAVLNGLREQLANPEALRLYVDEYVAERRRLAADIAKRRGQIENQIAKRKAEYNRLIDLAVRGLLTPDHLAERKGPIDEEIARLEAELAIVPPTKGVDLHPAALASFHEDMVVLAERLNGDNENFVASAVDPLRRLVSAVIIHPSRGREPVEIEIKGKLAALLGEGAEIPPAQKLAMPDLRDR
jgi:DNA invertase Pin-like site-specific DNA recombinase